MQGGSYDAILVSPAKGEGPGILLLQEIFGVNDFLLQKAEALAELGYVVMCPDVFFRVEPHVSLPHDDASLEKAFTYMGRYAAEVDEETKVSDLVSGLRHLAGLPDTTGRGTGVMGYCLGGFLAYLTAAAGDPAVCVSYYGSGISDHLELAGDISCPVLFHFGGNDPYIAPEQVEAVRQAFSDRPDVTFHVESDAGHAFENLLAPRFSNPEAAARSWPVTVDWLSSHLPAG